MILSPINFYIVSSFEKFELAQRIRNLHEISKKKNSPNDLKDLKRNNADDVKLKCNSKLWFEKIYFKLIFIHKEISRLDSTNESRYLKYAYSEK